MDNDTDKMALHNKPAGESLTDEAMANVAGGEIHYPSDGKADSREAVKFVYNVGDRVEVWQSIFGNTKRGTITGRRTQERTYTEFPPYVFCYYPLYNVRYDSGGVEIDLGQQYISR